MSTVGFIRSSLKQMHNTYNDAISDLSPEHMSWQNGPAQFLAFSRRTRRRLILSP